MKQLELFKDLKGKEIQLRERLATAPIPNFAYGEVTTRMKPEGGNPWAAGDKPKVLSPEITSIGKADKLHFLEGSDLPPLTVPLVKLESTERWPREQVVGNQEHCVALLDCIPCAIPFVDTHVN